MFERRYDIGDIAAFEMDILTKCEHSVFLKQSFSIAEGQIIANVDDSGYRKLSIQDIDSPLKLLDFLEKLFLKLNRAKNYMFDTNWIKLDIDAIYIDEHRNFAICFEPLKSPLPLNEAIEKLILKIEPSSTPCRDYIAMILNKLRENTALSKLITATGEMKREAYYCGYN